MTSSTSSRLVLALLANVAIASSACGDSFEEAQAEQPASGVQAPSGTSGGEPAKGPPVGGAAAQSDLTDALGVFVAPSGQDDADGTHVHPLATIRAGIEHARAAGKRVFVCAGTYREALVIADSISVIGGLDCTATEWRTGAGLSRVEAPSSPAIRATDLTSATRLEGLDIHAPDAAAPSGSSIGLLAYRASSLVVARTKIVAGHGKKGDDGADGVQLVQSARANGESAIVAGECSAFSACAKTELYKPPVTAGGTNTCQGAANFTGQAGGFGGSGGKWEVVMNGNLVFQVYEQNFSLGPGAGETNRTSAAGADGTPGANAAALGTFSKDGYLAAAGAEGSNGAAGSGGAGGSGMKPDGLGNYVGAIWHGHNAAGGGAGGCPGLGGTGGKGGGASVAAVLIESGITFDGSELAGGSGGDAGLGAFGSVATPGGQAGANPTGFGSLGAQPGGRGGAAGAGGNGSAGPSAAIVHAGAAPKLVGTNALSHGAGGEAVDARSRTDALGITKTIAATPAGAANDILAL